MLALRSVPTPFLSMVQCEVTLPSYTSPLSAAEISNMASSFAELADSDGSNKRLETIAQ
jgi:hypothetical protein